MVGKIALFINAVPIVGFVLGLYYC